MKKAHTNSEHIHLKKKKKSVYLNAIKNCITIRSFSRAQLDRIALTLKCGSMFLLRAFTLCVWAFFYVDALKERERAIV